MAPRTCLALSGYVHLRYICVHLRFQSLSPASLRRSKKNGTRKRRSSKRVAPLYFYFFFSSFLASSFLASARFVSHLSAFSPHGAPGAAACSIIGRPLGLRSPWIRA